MPGSKNCILAMLWLADQTNSIMQMWRLPKHSPLGRTFVMLHYGFLNDYKGDSCGWAMRTRRMSMRRYKIDIVVLRTILKQVWLLQSDIGLEILLLIFSQFQSFSLLVTEESNLLCCWQILQFRRNWFTPRIHMSLMTWVVVLALVHPSFERSFSRGRLDGFLVSCLIADGLVSPSSSSSSRMKGGLRLSSSSRSVSV